MPPAYGVQPEDVSAELPSLFGAGFSNDTRPSRAVVEAWLAAADVRVRLALASVAAGTPSPADASYDVARDLIVEYAKGKAMEVAYAGKVSAPDWFDLRRRNAENFADGLKALTALGEAAVGATVEAPAPSVVTGSIPLRAEFISDAMLDGSERRW